MGGLAGVGFVVFVSIHCVHSMFLIFHATFKNVSISFRLILLMAVVNIEAQKKPSISKFVSIF